MDGTGKSVSEVLSLESVNSQYDERSFIELQKNTSSEHVAYKKFCFCFDIQNNICTQHVLNLYVLADSMNNITLYCGLTD